MPLLYPTPPQLITTHLFTYILFIPVLHPSSLSLFIFPLHHLFLPFSLSSFISLFKSRSSFYSPLASPTLNGFLTKTRGEGLLFIIIDFLNASSESLRALALPVLLLLLLLWAYALPVVLLLFLLWAYALPVLLLLLLLWAFALPLLLLLFLLWAFALPVLLSLFLLWAFTLPVLLLLFLLWAFAIPVLLLLFLP